MLPTLRCRLEDDGSAVCPKDENPSWRACLLEGFGHPSATSGSIILTPIEVAYLLERGKIILTNTSEKYQEFLQSHVSKYLYDYLVYRDLRSRGYSVRVLLEDDRYAFSISRTPEDSNPEAIVVAVPSFGALPLEILARLLRRARKIGALLLIAVIDELGDIVYYLVNEELSKEARLKVS